MENGMRKDSPPVKAGPLRRPPGGCGGQEELSSHCHQSSTELGFGDDVLGDSIKGVR